MLTKEECEKALETLSSPPYESSCGGCICGVSDCGDCPNNKANKLLNQLIHEHFDNPPLEWEEIQELKKGDIIWDNLNKKNLKINFIEVSRWGEKIIDGWLEGDIMSLVYLFEPNRFYRKEVQE